VDFLVLVGALASSIYRRSDSSFEMSIFLSVISSDDRGLFSDSVVGVVAVLLLPAVLYGLTAFLDY